MGTSGAYGFRIDDTDKVTYNHFDSYPEWLGKQVVAFIKAHSVDEMRSIARSIVLVNAKTKPTPEQVKECERWTNITVSEQSTEDWYCLLREAQGNLEAYTQGLRYMIDDSSFLGDSLFCEWAYIINLDDGVLEVYVGFQKRQDKNPANRYRNLPCQYDKPEYYPVKLLLTFDLQRIPDDWLERVYKAAGLKPMKEAV